VAVESVEWLSASALRAISRIALVISTTLAAVVSMISERPSMWRADSAIDESISIAAIEVSAAVLERASTLSLTVWIDWVMRLIDSAVSPTACS
jgi:hypothetical protein